MTFEEWWSVWEASGHWEQRGRHRNQYCMSRYNDTGPYSVDNVCIKTVAENIQEWINVRPNPPALGMRHSEASRQKIGQKTRSRYELIKGENK